MREVYLISVALVCLLHLAQASAPGTSGSLDDPKIRPIIEKEAQYYLAAFGYMPKAKTRKLGTKKFMEPSKDEFRTALLCANKDMFNGEQLKDLQRSDLWKKKVLRWNVTSYPPSLTLSQTREACEEAFKMWRQVSAMDFVETKDASKADIVISFLHLPNSYLNELEVPIRKVVAGATRPINSRIMLQMDHIWGYRNHFPRGTSLFDTLLHEIGHTLGLGHNFYRGSIMYPILKPAIVPYGKLAGVPNVDRLALRKLYGAGPSTESKLMPPVDTSSSRCPKQIDSITYVTQSEWIAFLGNKVHRVRDRKFIDTGRKIQDVFPRGPGFVNATVTSKNTILLFAERVIYGYEYDGVSFIAAPGFPRELHERVLFYPQGAFPLNNGSIVLLSLGNVFATYDVFENRPSILEDKDRYFPNLPAEVRSGIPKYIRSTDEYWMFEEKTVSDYDMATKQIVQIEAITDFFKCI